MNTSIMLSPIFDDAKKLLDSRGAIKKRGLVWLDLPIDVLISLLYMKVMRMRAGPKVDDALDAINYSAMIVWRLEDNKILYDVEE